MFEERVAKGAALLDVVNAGWENRINVGTLDLSSCKYCIAGQLVGPTNALEIFMIRNDNAIRYGLNLDIVDIFNFVREKSIHRGSGGAYRELTKLWINAIFERRAVPFMEAERPIPTPATCI